MGWILDWAKTMTLPRGSESAFVGRRREMSDIGAALDGALSGNGRMLMLVGEPGIGKTRTSRELAAIAEQRGFTVLWGRCHEREGAPPYWPWIQAIRSHVRNCDADQIRFEMAAGAGDIAEVVPDVWSKLPDLLRPPPLDSPERARFRLFDSITTFLKNASGSRGLVLVLENLHWADYPSLLLLEFISQELGDSRLLVVGTYRDTDLDRAHPLTHTLGELAREPLFYRIELAGLSEEEVGSYINEISGIVAPRNLIEAVHAQTQGNPLFMTQVVHLLVQEGDLNSSQSANVKAWGVKVPEGVHEAIGRRLSRLSDSCHQVLSVASVVGREFELRLLETLNDTWGVDDLLDVLEEALAARVIEEIPTEVGRYQFTHVLIQNTLQRESSGIRRAQLHLRIAANLEILYGNECEAHATELAYHYAESVSDAATKKLITYSLLAGQQALDAYAHDEALDYFERALAASGVPTNGIDRAMDIETASLLFGLGRAQSAKGQLREAWVNIGRAFDYYIDSGNVENAVAVAEYPVLFTSGLSNATRFVETALTLVAPDSHEAGRLLSRYGLLRNLETGDFEMAQEPFSRALAIARREGDEVLEMRTLANAADANWHQLRGQEVLENCQRVIELARRANDPYTEMWPRFMAGHELIGQGDLVTANEHATSMLAQAERLRDTGYLTLACMVNEEVSRHKGDWLSTREFNDRGLALDPQQPWLLGYRAVMDYQLGEFTQGEQYLDRLIEAMSLDPPGPGSGYVCTAVIIPIIARITGDDRHLKIADAAAETVLSSPSATLIVTVWIRHALGQLAVLRQDPKAAEEIYSGLISLQSGRLYTAVDIVFDRLLGLLAVTTGDLDRGSVHFQEALRFCRNAGYKPELAWSCCDYADCLLQRNKSGDRQQAISLLDESFYISKELGMRPLMERVVERQLLVGSRQDTGPDYPDGLSHREIEVLRLVAAGNTNQEIAEKLLITISTVANHVAKILSKTDSTNRAGAATYASRQGLV